MKLSVIAACLAGVTIATAATPPTPKFFARRDYTGLTSGWLQVADTNADGIPDLITGGSAQVEVQFGNGNGTFRQGPKSQNVMSYAPSFVATDVNRDGKVDLLLAGQQGPTLQWGIGVCLGNGDGTFQPAVFYPAGSDTDLGFLVVRDFNGDGVPDVVTAGASGIWLFIGNGNGTFNPGVLTVALSTAGSGAIVTTDFNGDGNLDLVVTLRAGTKGAGFAVILGNGNGTFQAPQMFKQPHDALGLAVGRLTKGGHPGIAVGTLSTADVYLYFGKGDGTFSGPHYTNLPAAYFGGLAIGDVNGDGVPDLVSEGVDIALGTGNGTFKPPIYYPVQASGGTSHVVLADLRHNGLTDIVTSSSSAISVLLSLGKGKYEDGIWTPVAGGAGCGAAADYNGDGKPDLAVNNNQGVTILLGTGKAGSPFTTGASIALSGAGCLTTGDLNGDGIADLLVPASGKVVAYLGNGDGTFRLKGSTAIPTGGFVALADVNHDGKLDFATSGNLLAIGNGDGTFQTAAPFVSNPPSNGFGFITAGDMNNDGWPDLVLTDALNGGLIYVLLNNQHGGFTQIITSQAGQPAQVALADLNGDGNLDAIVASLYGGADVWLGNGAGGFTFTGLLGDLIIGVPYLVAIADVNGDGIPDAVLLEGSTVGVLLGKGDATFKPQIGFGAGPGPGFILTQNLHGQSPSAGLPDIVAPDLSGGVTVLINTTR